jgi:pentatricopeptide repeat protein
VYSHALHCMCICDCEHILVKLILLCTASVMEARTGKAPIKKVYKSVIAVCAKTGQWQQACGVLQLMLQQPNMQVTSFLWNIVAAAIGRAGR